jgi:CDP-4-dehydro-6-deoxyglucose reductase
VTRAYSIASLPNGNRFELCLNLVEGGLLSPRLFALKPGDTVAMKGPLGGFTLMPSAKDSVFVASGTGIAPFRAMIPAALAAAPSREVTLVFGTRHESGILYGDEFSDLARRDGRFRYWPTLTRAQPDWPGRRGRVQEHLGEVVAGRRDLMVYVCGLKAMVDDVRAMLRGTGFERSQVRYEKYD